MKNVSQRLKAFWGAILVLLSVCSIALTSVPSEALARTVICTPDGCQDVDGPGPVSTTPDTCELGSGTTTIDPQPDGTIVVTPRSVEAGPFECSFLTTTPMIPGRPQLRVEKAIVQLPEGVTGTVEEFSILAICPNGETKRAFGCSNQNAASGVDLISTCGGPAYLSKDATLEYAATIADFSQDAEFAIELTATQSTAFVPGVACD